MVSRESKDNDVNPKAIFTLPVGGGDLTIYAGDTEFDFYHGMIHHADGTNEAMEASLRGMGTEFCHGIRVDSDEEAMMWFDTNKGKRTIEASGSVTLKHFPFRSLYLRVSVTSYVKVFASSLPDGVIVDNTMVSVDSSSAKGGKAATGTYNTVTVGGTAALIKAANPLRKAIEIQNTSANDLYIGTDSSVTTATGKKLKTDIIYVDTEYTGAWYGISGGANLDVRYQEFE
ncbi:MAG: hypothetical protein PHG80_12455 [Methanoregulaceae archaeon]|nr:hypothetical protein [Methanoregulaceae archaeon]